MVKCNKMNRRGLIILVLLLTTGCTSAYKAYPGPPRQESEIAVITPESGVRIHALNDKVVSVEPGSKAKGMYTAYNCIHARPGEYTLTLVPHGDEMANTYTKLTVRVEAGQHYRVRSQFNAGTPGTRGYYKLWVDNKKTGALVSKIVESHDPFQPDE